MRIVRRRGWELPEGAATPEGVFMDRRRFLAGAGAILGAGLASGGALAAADADPSAGRYPVTRNPRYTLDRPLTDPGVAAAYNNFYEFGSHKRIARAARDLVIRPWTVRIDGLVERQRTVDIDDLLGRLPLEERLYRHRCVEAWAMTVPWSGIPMRAFVEFARPLGSAKYVEMRTFLDSGMAPGQRQFWYPWPYLEGLSIAEATSELAFLATGIYGKPMPKQHGAPIRLVAPWKYGFKSVKSIVGFTFTEERPKSFWQTVQGEEYGFWANVNPGVPHPRWSQASERLIGTDERVPTRIWNGYGPFVAHLYADMKGERLFF